MAAPISLEDATRKFQSSAPKYVALPGLVRKHYIRAADGSTAGGVYLWQSRAASSRSIPANGWSASARFTAPSRDPVVRRPGLGRQYRRRHDSPDA
ncbi:MAG: hypothetical protein R3D02_03655 [Hyphomicrobiales bacterium]